MLLRYGMLFFSLFRHAVATRSDAATPAFAAITAMSPLPIFRHCHHDFHTTRPHHAICRRLPPSAIARHAFTPAITLLMLRHYAAVTLCWRARMQLL